MTEKRPAVSDHQLSVPFLCGASAVIAGTFPHGGSLEPALRFGDRRRFLFSDPAAVDAAPD
jgi:hypothetical protein